MRSIPILIATSLAAASCAPEPTPEAPAAPPAAAVESAPTAAPEREGERDQRALRKLAREAMPQLVADIDATFTAFLEEDMTALPMTRPADIRAARTLLERRRAIAERGRRAVEGRIDALSSRALAIMGDDHPPRASAEFARGIRHSLRDYFAILDLEEQQITAQQKIAALLLDPKQVSWADGGGYRTPTAEARHGELDAQVRSLETQKAAPMQRLMQKLAGAAPSGR